MNRLHRGRNVVDKLESTFEYFKLSLVCDALVALKGGYTRGELTLLIVSADNEEWRANFLDRVLPRADWRAIRRRRERPFAIGVVPPELLDMLDVTHPLLRPMREQSSKSCVQPVVIIGPRGETMVTALHVPDVPELP